MAEAIVGDLADFDHRNKHLKDVHIIDMEQKNIECAITQFTSSITTSTSRTGRSGPLNTSVEPDKNNQKDLNKVNENATCYGGYTSNSQSRLNSSGKRGSGYDNIFTSNDTVSSIRRAPEACHPHGSTVTGSSTGAAYSQSSREEFEAQMPNRTVVKIYKADITKLAVDVIVNAANEHLDHIGGVAYAICYAAGKDFHCESDRYVKKHGEVKVFHVAITSAGKLPCKNVIQAVGPVWSGYRDKDQNLLTQAFLNSFNAADYNLAFHSLAVPPISSGITYYSIL